MHELSIALGIVKLAEKTAGEHNTNIVKRIDLDIGKLAGVEYDALEFVWNTAVKESVLEGAQKVINKIEGKAQCSECGTQFIMEKLYDNCPRCKSYFNEIISGKELRVRSLIIN